MKTNSPLNWPAIITFIITSVAALVIAPWYGFTHGFSSGAWIAMIVLYILTGISITTGYHRLWSHSTYKAHWLARAPLALFGGMAVQNSILTWCAGHRYHHRFVDNNDKDPYSAKKGFWYSHMGWMLRHYKSTEVDYSVTPDLQRDKIVMFQHNYYGLFAVGANILIPVALGLVFGDVWGYLLLAGFVRVFAVHHSTFFINSWAHMWGTRPYTDENTARDNWLLAFFTFGEGYHNYHHIFQNDYRNGIKWYQFDPTKWLINILSWLGLATDLKTVSDFKIRRRMVEMQFKRMNAKSDKLSDQVRQKLEQEYAHFKETLHDWTELQTERYEQAKEQLKEKWHQNMIELETALLTQHQRMAVMLKQHA